MEPRQFDERLKKLEKDLNEGAKEWLHAQMADKEKWALAFDVGGWRYGIMTTNMSEGINNVLKGVCALPVSAIIEFTFYRCNKYFVDRWQHAQQAIVDKKLWGDASWAQFEEGDLKSIGQEAILFDPTSHIYEVKCATSTNAGGETSGGRVFRVDLTAVTCTCRKPQLWHMPCSHMMAACRKRGVDHYSTKYLDPVYVMAAALRTWETRFNLILDPSEWPPCSGREYVPDSSMKRTKVGRRKKKRLRNEMNESNGYGEDIDGFGDFDQTPTPIICGHCGEQGHRVERHMVGPGTLS